MAKRIPVVQLQGQETIEFQCIECSASFFRRVRFHTRPDKVRVYTALSSEPFTTVCEGCAKLAGLRLNVQRLMVHD